MTATATELAQDQSAQGDAVLVEDGEDLVLADLLVEEISIDGMCGVY